jgi:hypothetical protein
VSSTPRTSIDKRDSTLFHDDAELIKRKTSRKAAVSTTLVQQALAKERCVLLMNVCTVFRA